MNGFFYFNKALHTKYKNISFVILIKNDSLNERHFFSLNNNVINRFNIYVRRKGL